MVNWKLASVVGGSVFIAIIAAKAVEAYVPLPVKTEIISLDKTTGLKVTSFTDDDKCEYLVFSDGHSISVTERKDVYGYSYCMADHRDNNGQLNTQSLMTMAQNSSLGR